MVEGSLAAVGVSGGCEGVRAFTISGDQAAERRNLTVPQCTCVPGTFASSGMWCPRADELFGVEGMHLLDVHTDDDGVVRVDVETDQTLTGCTDCGVVAI